MQFSPSFNVIQAPSNYVLTLMQALWHAAIVPIAEERADPNAYGFRPKRSTQDAIEQCFKMLARKNSARWIFEGDIRACFDQISHEWLINQLNLDQKTTQEYYESPCS